MDCVGFVILIVGITVTFALYFKKEVGSLNGKTRQKDELLKKQAELDRQQANSNRIRDEIRKKDNLSELQNQDGIHLKIKDEQLPSIVSTREEFLKLMLNIAGFPNLLSPFSLPFLIGHFQRKSDCALMKKPA